MHLRPRLLGLTLAGLVALGVGTGLVGSTPQSRAMAASADSASVRPASAQPGDTRPAAAHSATNPKAVKSKALAKPCGGTKIRKAPGRYWACSFDDEFSGTALDIRRWWAPKPGSVGNSGGDQCYDPANVSVSRGVLNLTTTRPAAAFDCAGHSTRYRSGMVLTSGLFTQTYGRYEIRAKFPPGLGLQPAIWMLPQHPFRGPDYYYGEIDIAEAWGRYPGIVSPHLHYVSTPGTPQSGAYCTVQTSNSAFHTYAVEWTTTRMRFSYDGKTCWTTTWAPAPPFAPARATSPAPFDQPFYLILNLGVGDSTTPGNRPDAKTPFPARMQVDYVRVWK